MIIHDVEQGTPEWLRLRLGIPTASQFTRLVTPKTRKLSGSIDGYVNELLAEWFIGEPVVEIDSPWMSRGRELESEARAWYSMDIGADVRQVGFVTDDEATAGCSPDGLVGDAGGVEIKCPSAGVHVGYMLGGDHKYELQMQGCMWLTDRQWWDFVSYNPSLPPYRVRYERDNDLIQVLSLAVELVTERLDAGRDRLAELGAKRREPVEVTPNRCHALVPDHRGDGETRWCMQPAPRRVGGEWYCEEHAA